MTSIYVLIHPISERPFYVGKTTKPLKTRLSGHISEATNQLNWSIISELRKNKLRPIIKLIDVCADDDSTAIEQMWVEKYLRRGFILTNRLFFRLRALDKKRNKIDLNFDVMMALNIQAIKCGVSIESLLRHHLKKN